MQELLWKTWRRNFCQPGRTAWYIFSIDLPWNYDKRYEVTSPISIEDNEEISNETPFKVASISDTVLLVDDNIEILAYLQRSYQEDLGYLQHRMDAKHWKCWERECFFGGE